MIAIFIIIFTMFSAEIYSTDLTECQQMECPSDYFCTRGFIIINEAEEAYKKGLYYEFLENAEKFYQTKVNKFQLKTFPIASTNELLSLLGVPPQTDAEKKLNVCLDNHKAELHEFEQSCKEN